VHKVNFYKRKLLLTLICILTIIFAFSSWGGASARPLQAAVLSLNPTSGYAGSETQVMGTGWTKSPDADPYEIHGGSKTGPLLATFEPNPNGAFSVEITIPAGAAPGTYTIWACQNCADLMKKIVWASIPFEVLEEPAPTPTPAPPPPPPTREPTECDRSGIAGEFVIDFEDQAAGTRLDGTTLAPGIRFMGDDALVVVRPSVDAHSGSQALFNDFAGREFGSINIPIRIGFDNLADFVGVFVGLNEQIWADEPFTATLTAYGLDDFGRRVVVGSDSDTLGPEETAIEVCLAVEAPGQIFEVTINYNVAGGVAEGEIIDDLVIRGPEEPVPVPEDDLPPVVEILEPLDGAHITDRYVRLSGQITEDRELARVEVWVNGSSYGEIGFSPAGESTYIFALDALSGVDLTGCFENEVEVRTYDSAGNEGADTAAFFYDPIGDFSITSAEAVQVVYDADLVKEKATAFRVKVNSTFACDSEIDVLLDLPEDEWSTAPPRTGLHHTGVPGGWEYPDTWGPYTIPGNAVDYEIMLPYIAPGDEDSAFDPTSHPAGIIRGREVAGVWGPDVRVVPRPTGTSASFQVTLDPENLLAETDESNNDFAAPAAAVVGTREWKILFVPYYDDFNDCGPVLGGLAAQAKTQIEYLLATYPIADGEISYAIAPAFNLETCIVGDTCGWNMVWENGLDRYDFLNRIGTMAAADGYNFAVGVSCGGGGGAIKGFDKAVAIGEGSGMSVLAHEFNHAMTAVGDMYSLDCQVGWDEAYCEYPDGHREYCCYEDIFDRPDGYTTLNCTYDAAGEVVCEEQTKVCVDDCDCSIYRLEPPAGESRVCVETDDSGDYVIEACNAGCCANVCRGICPGAQVFNGPDGRINHPASPGYWVNRWIPAGEGNNYFMDIPSAGAFPGYWMRLENTSNHCDGDPYPDGMRNMLAGAKFRSSTDPQALLVSGTIFKADTASFYPFYYLPEADLDLEAGSEGEYAIVLLDGSEQELSRNVFSVYFEDTDPNGGPTDAAPFVYRIAWMEGTARIELRDADGSVLAAREVSSHAPEVRLTSPNGGEIWGQDHSHEIRWKGSDADGDALTYTLSISADAGENWIPLAIDLTETQFEVNLGAFPVGATFMIKVRATDGVNSSEDVSDKIFAIHPEEAVPVSILYIAVLAVIGVFVLIAVVTGLLLARRGSKSAGGDGNA